MPEAGADPSAMDPLFRQRLETALGRLGAHVARWKDAAASVRRDNTRFELDLATIAPQTPEPLESLDDVGLTIVLGDALGVTPPEEALTDYQRVRGFLRPRLFNRAFLEGPRRDLCRRDAFGDLISGVRVGPGERARTVTTRLLDAWGVEFDQVLATATTNLARRIRPDWIREVEDAQGLLAVVPDHEPAASAYFVLDTLLPDLPRDPGLVFAVPGDEILLVLPVVAGSGADGLAGLVRLVFEIAAGLDDPLSDGLFWRRGERVDELRMTRIHVGNLRRVQMEAEGTVAELLRVLGTIE